MKTTYIKIPVNERLPDNDNIVPCWSVKFGDEKSSISSHWVLLSWNGRFWEDEDGKDYEDNPDYHLITFWIKALEHPLPAIEGEEKNTKQYEKMLEEKYFPHSPPKQARKFIITAELRELEKQVAIGEISYGRMVELLNEKAEEYANQFKNQQNG